MTGQCDSEHENSLLWFIVVLSTDTSSASLRSQRTLANAHACPLGLRILTVTRPRCEANMQGWCILASGCGDPGTRMWPVPEGERC
jgi:hypothetical protein